MARDWGDAKPKQQNLGCLAAFTIGAGIIAVIGFANGYGDKPGPIAPSPSPSASPSAAVLRTAVQR